MRLLPREERFFLLFQDQVRLTREASVLLKSSCCRSAAELAAMMPQLTELEHRGDKIVHEVFVRLNQTFLTPLDPEDIHALSSRLDSVLDAIEEAGHRLSIYRLEPMPESVRALCDGIDGCVAALGQAFDALSSTTPINDYCVEVNRLEEVADGIFRQALADLFEHERDPIRLLKSKELHELLEQVTDRCEDVADALQAVMVKNS